MALLASAPAGDEEVGHFLIARHAPGQAELFLSLVGRPLVTLVLSLPAQSGLWAARLLSACATGFTAYVVARLAGSTGRLHPAWAVAFLMVQVFFLSHAGTAMTEPWAALLVSLVMFGLVQRRAGTMAAASAVLPLARFELMVFWPWVAWALWRQRKWPLALTLPLPLLGLNFIGSFVSGDLLWLAHQAAWKTYPERPPWHYLMSFVWIAGYGLFVPVTSACVGGLGRSGSGRGVLGVSAGVLFLTMATYTFFAWWRPLTFGNLRYMAAAAPAIALLAFRGVGALSENRNRWGWAGLLIALAGAVFVWNHPLFHDHTVLSRVSPWPAIVAAAWFLLYTLPPPARRAAPGLALTLSLAGLFLNHRQTLHLEPTAEQAAVREAAKLVGDDRGAARAWYAGHPYLHFLQGTNMYDRRRFGAVSSKTLASAPEGSLLFWDSHYTPGVNPETLMNHPGWTYRGGVIAADTSWVGALFEKGGGKRPGHGPPPEDLTVAARFALAGVAGGREMARADAGNPDAWRALAGRLYMAGFHREAFHVHRRVKGMDPLNPRDDAMQAEILCQAGRLPEALQLADRALSRGPGEGAVIFLRARILEKLGRTAEARQSFVEAADRLPNQWEAQYRAGRSLHRAGLANQAEEYFLRGLMLNPRHEESAFHAADIAYGRGDRHLAAERLKGFLRLKPDSIIAAASLGDVLMELNRRREAVSVWREALALAPGDTLLAARLREHAGPGEPQASGERSSRDVNDSD